MILPESVADYANQALDALRHQCNKPVYPGHQGADLLSMRAQLMQLKPATQVSANGSCHLLSTRDQQWLALNLARRSDWELLPALFGSAEPINTLEQVAALVKNSLAADVLAQGRSLGLPLALAKKTTPLENKNCVSIICRGVYTERSKSKHPTVLDLSSLWAGPLCSQLLQQAGARVTKVESKHRPDGAGLNRNTGGQEFFAELNKNKVNVMLDFSQATAIQQLKQLITEADIVIEGSRPRALQQLGIDAEAMVQQQPGLVWVSITGYGRQQPQANWVAFGDDAAISAGLYDLVDKLPVFIGDAIADPLTGLQAALAAYTSWQRGEAVLLDINLHQVACCAANSHL